MGDLHWLKKTGKGDCEKPITIVTIKKCFRNDCFVARRILLELWAFIDDGWKLRMKEMLLERTAQNSTAISRPTDEVLIY
jgi:hypothetical protein